MITAWQAITPLLFVLVRKLTCLEHCCRTSLLQPSPLGQLVLAELAAISTHYPTARLDAWVLMPNHLHLILVLTRHQTVAVSQVVSGFKSRCFRQWRTQLLAAGQPAPPSCWQRNYYERIIRDASELEGHRRYILENPSRW